MKIDLNHGAVHVALVLLVAFGSMGLGTWLIAKSEEMREDRKGRKMEWAKDHGCRRTGYMGSPPEVVFTCPNGDVYSLTDLPEKK
jgi:hypothetical protein